MKRQTKIVLWVVGILFAAFVWPTMYRYDKYGTSLTRTNRFTSRVQYLYLRGWDYPSPATQP